jgi:hypothetical protein
VVVPSPDIENNSISSGLYRDSFAIELLSDYSAASAAAIYISDF